VNTLGQVFIVVAVLSVGVVYGTDLFSAIALRPALALVDDRTLVSTMGRVHEFADRRMRVPGVVGLLTTIAGSVFIGIAGHVGATISGVVAVVAQATWLVIYARISAPINARLTAAAKAGETPADARRLQQRWDSVIDARSGLQMMAILALSTVLITA
jgi:hypothetical protein